MDPQLQLVSGSQYRPHLLGSFADAAPDRWGRNLVTKRERELAREQHRRPRNLDDVDFLLGVSDTTRQGALRFRLPGTAEFLGAHTTIPRTIALPALLRASDEADADVEGTAALKTLLDAGTGSLGGARPKAAVLLEDGALGLAKFPHAGDDWDVMAWEATALDMAAAVGIATPEHRLVPVGDRNVLLLRRFDRSTTGDRIGYISAMTVLGAVDGDQADYADLAIQLADVSASLRSDRRDLFARVALSVAIGNTDDHLRNHGFLMARGGWRFSPVFDINPNPDPGATRRTSIAGAVSVDDEVEGLLALADECGLTAIDARERFAATAAAVGGWRTVARRYKIPEREQAMMAESIEPRLDALRREAAIVPFTPPAAQPGSRHDERGRFAARPRPSE